MTIDLNPKPSAEQIRATARLRADRACAFIERAQNDLANACAELSALTGGIPVWKATGKMHDRVKELWWRVHQFRNGARFSLDSTNIAGLARRLREESWSAEHHAEAVRTQQPCPTTCEHCGGAS